MGQHMCLIGEYDTDMTDQIHIILFDYNDTLKKIFDPKIPDSLREFLFDRGCNSLGWVVDGKYQRWKPQFKGQRPKWDMYKWLYYHPEQWARTISIPCNQKEEEEK